MINNEIVDNVALQEEMEIEADDKCEEVMEFHKTKHSKRRCRQRGIKESDLQLIMDLGTTIRKPGGVYEYFIGKKDRERTIENLKQLIQKLDKLKGKAIIVNEDGSETITAYHKDN